MTTEAIRLLTADDLLTIPDTGVQHELQEGQLICMAPASSKPSLVAAEALTALNVFVRPRKLGRVGGADWGFRLKADPDTVRAPDVAFVRAERIPATGIPGGYRPGAPDPAIEAVSPCNRHAGVLQKVAEYLEAGARLVWVLFPEERMATVYRPSGPPQTVAEDGSLSGEDVVPGFTLTLAEIWV